MSSIFAVIGVLSVLLAVLLIIRKADIIHYRRKIAESIRRDDRIYDAAGEFARGKPAEEIRKALASIVFLDEEDIDDILMAAEPYRLSADGGYGAFICEVNKSLGYSVY